MCVYIYIYTHTHAHTSLSESSSFLDVILSRKWSLETGKCQTIFRGHRDTILCLKVYNDKMISGAKDRMCKVWLIDSGKCIRTFKHKHPVTAVTMGEDPLPEIAVSGCEAGKVKVWDLKSGQLIKVLFV